MGIYPRNQCHLAGLALLVLGEHNIQAACHEDLLLIFEVKQCTGHANEDGGHGGATHRHFLVDSFSPHCLPQWAHNVFFVTKAWTGEEKKKGKERCVTNPTSKSEV